MLCGGNSRSQESTALKRLYQRSRLESRDVRGSGRYLCRRHDSISRRLKLAESLSALSCKLFVFKWQALSRGRGKRLGAKKPITGPAVNKFSLSLSWLVSRAEISLREKIHYILSCHDDGKLKIWDKREEEH